MATPRHLPTDHAIAALPRLQQVHAAAEADDAPAADFLDSAQLALDIYDGAEVCSIGEAQINGFAFGFDYQRGHDWPDSVGPSLVEAGLGEWEEGAFQLEHLAVHPDHQEQGLGTTLLEFVQSRHDKVLLATTPGNPAKRLFRRMGFTVLLPGYVYFGSEDKSMIMGWQKP